MALIKCPACDKEVSEYAYVCPHCGEPFDEDDEGRAPVTQNDIRALKLNLVELNNKVEKLYKLFLYELIAVAGIAALIFIATR